MAWNFQRLFTEIIDAKNGPESTVNWLTSNGFIPASKLCECGRDMPLRKIKANVHNSFFPPFRCRRTSKHSSGKEIVVSRIAGTLFQNTKMAPDRIFIVMLSFANNLGHEQAMKELSYQVKPSNTTLFDYYRLFRELMSESLIMSSNEERTFLGENGAVVKVFNSKFKHPKFKSGKSYEGMRLFIMIELNTAQFRVDLCPDGDIEAQILLFQKHISPKTIILTEDWQELAAYVDGYFEFTNEASYNPVTGEVLQHEAIKRVPIDNYFTSDDMGEKILEYLFRFRCEESKSEVFDEMLKAMKKLYPLKSEIKS